MKIEIKPDGVWYHGSNELFSELRTDSTITQWKELAEAFSYQPAILGYDDNGAIFHNGVEKGYLYRIDESVDIQNDIYQHPGTTMDENAEFLTKRPLKVKMIYELTGQGESAVKEDRIISALIGLAGACNNNPKTADTDSLVIKALAFPFLCPEHDDKALQEMIDEIYAEKYSVAPGCAECTAPCGNTSDYDMRRIYEADEGVRDAKLQILAKLRKLAAYICQCQKTEMPSYADVSFFYKALLYVSYDMEEKALFGLLDEADKIEHDIKAGGIQNGQEDHKN